MYLERQKNSKQTARCEWCKHYKKKSPPWCDAWKMDVPLLIKECVHYKQTYFPESEKRKHKKASKPRKEQDVYETMRRYMDMIYEEQAPQ